MMVPVMRLLLLPIINSIASPLSPHPHIYIERDSILIVYTHLIPHRHTQCNKLNMNSHEQHI